MVKLKGNIFKQLYGKINCYFTPEEIYEGMITTGGLRLIKPSTESIPEVKWAFLTDKRIFDEKLYKEFEKFMPPNMQIIGPPAEQDPFTYVLGLEGQIKKMKFQSELSKNYKRKSNGEKGDIVAYYKDDILDSVDPFHAGIYLGNDRAKSRFTFGYPVIEHILDDTPFFDLSNKNEIIWDFYSKK